MCICCSLRLGFLHVWSHLLTYLKPLLRLLIGWALALLQCGIYCIRDTLSINSSIELESIPVWRLIVYHWYFLVLRQSLKLQCSAVNFLLILRPLVLQTPGYWYLKRKLFAQQVNISFCVTWITWLLIWCVLSFIHVFTYLKVTFQLPQCQVMERIVGSGHIIQDIFYTGIKEAWLYCTLGPPFIVTCLSK